MGGDPHADHSTERVAKQDGRRRNALLQKTNNVSGVLDAAISSRDVAGLAMSAQIRRKDMPPHAQARNQRQEYLPAPAQAVQQHKWGSVGFSLGIVQLDRSGVEDLLIQPVMMLGNCRFQWDAPAEASHTIF